MKFKLKKRHTFAVGIPIGLLVFAIGREVWRAFAVRPPAIVISDAFSAVGSLHWVDTTLVTGLAAVAAATGSIWQIRRQIAADEASVREQMRQTAELNAQNVAAKHAAARAILPLSLSAVCHYAQECASISVSTLGKLEDGWLKSQDRVKMLPSLDGDVISVIKEMIEFGSHSDRRYLAKLISSVQVQAARLSAIGAQSSVTPSLTIRENILTCILDAAEVYAYASSLFGYARDQGKSVPSELELSELRTSINIVAGYGAATDEVHERAERLFAHGYYS